MIFKVPRHLEKFYGTTVDGQNPCFPDCPSRPRCFQFVKDPELPKPKQQPRICPPPEPKPGCYVHTPQPKNYLNFKYPNKYCPRGCDRPCCRHIVSTVPCCKYDDPCKATCFNHCPGVKPSGRYPPDIFKGYMFK